MRIRISVALALSFLSVFACAENATFDPTTGIVRIPAVDVSGHVEYVNVKLGLNQNGTFSVISAESPAATNSLSCSTYVSGTTYCADGVYPTCTPALSQIHQLQVGMSYDEVIQILGCHGVHAAGGGNIAVYTWGTPSYSYANASFVDGLLHSFGGHGG